jgi:hypothetical protein
MNGETVINGVTKVGTLEGFSYLFPIGNLKVNTTTQNIEYSYYTVGDVVNYTINFTDLLANYGATTAEGYVDILALLGAYNNATATSGGGGSISLLSNTVVVSQASDFDNIDFTKVYQLDGVVDVTAVEIVVPSGSVFELVGNSSDLCGAVSATDNQTFVSGQGQFKFNGCFHTLTGIGSKVYDMNGSSASVECSNANFYSCTKIGSINGIRQGFQQNVFWLGCGDGIDATGANGGFFNNGVLVRDFNPDDNIGGTVFKVDPTATFSTRFFSNANIQVDGNSTAYEFIDANFLSDSLLQLDNGNLFGTGTFVNGITQNSVNCNWKGTNGIKDTNIGAIWEMTTATLINIVASNTFQQVTLTTTAKKNTHHSQPAPSVIRYLGERAIDEAISGNVTMRAGNNRQVSIDVRVNGVSVFEATETTDGNGRARNIAIFGYNEILQNQDVTLFIKTDDGSNVTIDRAGLRLNKE